MSPRRILALGRLELRATGPLVLAWAVGYLLFIGLIVQQTSEPPKVIAPLWGVAGLLAGAGLVARDRRLGTAPMLGSLPIRPTSLVLVRLGIRGLLVGAGCALVLAVHGAWCLRWEPGSQTLWIGNIRAGLLLAVAGLLLGAAFSSVSPRESHAFGGGFLALVAWGALWLGLIVIHPYGTMLFEMAFPPALAAVVVLGLLAPLALVRAVRSRDPVSATERWRALGPLAVTLILILVVYGAWPSVKLAAPLSSYHRLDRLVPIPDRPELLAQAVQLGGRTSHRLGLWRIGPEGQRQVAPPALYNWSAAPGGKHLACHRMSRWLWRQGSRVELRQMDGEPVRVHETPGLSFWRGLWSPDGRTYAYRNSSTRETNAIEFLSVDPQREAVAWSPPDATLQNRRQLSLAGWLDGDTALCVDIGRTSSGQPASESRARLWVLTSDGQGRIAWEGSLGPALPYTWPARVSRARGTLLVKRRQSEDPNEPAWLLEIDPSSGAELRQWPIDPWGQISLDRDGGRTVWTQLGPEGSEISILDLASGERRSVTTPRVEDPRISPDGRFAATRVVEGPHRKQVLLLDLETDRFELHLAEVEGLAWLGSGELAVLQHGRLLRMNPEGGEVSTLWTGRGAGGES